MVENRKPAMWVALSHCWGTAQPLITETSNVENHCREIALSKMPRTFRDAIFVTRALGIRYIWIDSLCILQDSKKDWLSESAMMEDVYRNAVLTISADAAPNSSTGLVHFSPKDEYPDHIIATTTCYSSRHGVCGKIYFRGIQHKLPEQARGPLSSRGWTLQEEILSPRILHFTQQSTFWRCVEGRTDEGCLLSESPHFENWFNAIYPDNGLDSYHRAINPLPRGCWFQRSYSYNNIMEYWYFSVLDPYISRRLTYETDKFIAIGGIARVLQPHIDSKYKAGLWVDDIHRGLLWIPNEEGHTQGATRYEHFVAPSWSWASLGFEKSQSQTTKKFLYEDLRDWSITPLGHIQEISVDNVNEDPFGQVVSGKIVIQGQCCAVCTCTVPVAFFDERISQYEDDSAKYEEYEEYDRSIGWGIDESLEHRDSPHWRDYFWNYSTVNNASANGFNQLRIEKVGEELCKNDTGVEHSEVLYLKIARLTYPRCNTIIAGLILKETRNEKGDVLYTRVGRVLMTEKSIAVIDAGIDVYKDTTSWPERIVTII